MKSADVPEGEAAFGQLLRAVERLLPASGKGGMPMLAFQIWAFSHGVATLASAGQIPRDVNIDPRAALASGVQTLIRGAAAVAR